MATKALRNAIKAAMVTAFTAGYEFKGASDTVAPLTAEIVATFPEVDGWEAFKIRNVIRAQHSFGKWDREDELTVLRREQAARRKAEIAEAVAGFTARLKSLPVIGPFEVESVTTGERFRING
jgi:hypothetical protein